MRQPARASTPPIRLPAPAISSSSPQAPIQDQSINPKSSATSPDVVIQAAAGATVTIKELQITAAWLTLRNMTVMPVAGRGENDKIIDINHGTRHLTFDNVDLDGRINGVRQVRDGLGISGDTDYVTVRNSDICCIQDHKLIQIQTYGTSIQNRHLTFSGNTIHDDPQSSSTVHLECLWLEGISDFLLEGNHFWDCALNAILANADEGGTYANWTIINNVFEDADAGVGGVPPDFDGCASTHPKTNWLFAYNYFSRGLALTSCRGTMRLADPARQHRRRRRLHLRQRRHLGIQHLGPAQVLHHRHPEQHHHQRQQLRRSQGRRSDRPRQLPRLLVNRTPGQHRPPHPLARDRRRRHPTPRRKPRRRRPLRKPLRNHDPPGPNPPGRRKIVFATGWASA